jgi:hypothetical protein
MGIPGSACASIEFANSYVRQRKPASLPAYLRQAALAAFAWRSGTFRLRKVRLTTSD